MAEVVRHLARESHERLIAAVAPADASGGG
jgi:hypothetical protein